MKKVLNTITDVTRVGSNIDILSTYKLRDSSVYVFVSQIVQTVGGVSFKEGEIGATYNNFTTRLSINNKGELVAVGDKADNFDINSNLELTYTYE